MTGSRFWRAGSSWSRWLAFRHYGQSHDLAPASRHVRQAECLPSFIMAFTTLALNRIWHSGFEFESSGTKPSSASSLCSSSDQSSLQDVLVSHRGSHFWMILVLNCQRCLNSPVLLSTRCPASLSYFSAVMRALFQ